MGIFDFDFEQPLLLCVEQPAPNINVAFHFDLHLSFSCSSPNYSPKPELLRYPRFTPPFYTDRT